MWIDAFVCVFGHIILYNSEVPPTCLCILTEFCEDGTLQDWLQKHTDPHTREKKQVMKIFEQVCDIRKQVRLQFPHLCSSIDFSQG